MTYAIVCSSLTGNTRILADAIRQCIPDGHCVYFGSDDPAALAADCIFVGFWTNQGTCDSQTADFLKTLTNQQVFLFGTAGFGGSTAYFEEILENTRHHLPDTATLAGQFMCQGKMPMSVRARYEKMKAAPPPDTDLDLLITNFDEALHHPNSADLFALRQALPFGNSVQ